MRDSKRQTRSTLKGLLTVGLVALATVNGMAQTASNTYRGAARDPFTKFRPALKRKVEKKVAMPVPVPPIQTRISNYKAQKLAAMNLQQAAPKPTTALTLSELQVIGIFRTPRGYAAMVQATPIKLSYVVYPGETFFDGMLVAIEETRLVFRKQTHWTDGRTEVAVETMPLRVANAVADSMSAQNTAPPAAPASPAASASDSTKPEVNTLVEAVKAALAASAQQQQQNIQDATEGHPNGKP
jgi:hypothetical protein